MREKRVTITVVLDPNFGDRVFEAAVSGPVWVTPSAANRLSVEQYWRKHANGAGVSVTYWSEPRTGATEEEWLGILDDLELHHSEDCAGPGIATIHVIGASLSAAAAAALREFGYHVGDSQPDSFWATRMA